MFGAHACATTKCTIPNPAAQCDFTEQTFLVVILAFVSCTHNGAEARYLRALGHPFTTLRVLCDHAFFDVRRDKWTRLRP